MRLLLDTHIFLWAVAGSPPLKPPVRRLIESADEVYVSAASIWEIAIKARLGKIEADPHELAAAIEASGFLELPVSAMHAAGVTQLALHHNDPFDRLLIARHWSSRSSWSRSTQCWHGTATLSSSSDTPSRSIA